MILLILVRLGGTNPTARVTRWRAMFENREGLLRKVTVGVFCFGHSNHELVEFKIFCVEKIKKGQQSWSFLWS